MPSHSVLCHAPFRAWHLPAYAALIAGLLAFGQVRAAEDADDELARLLAQPVFGGARLASASKYEQDAAEAPSLVYVRTGGEIRSHGYRTLAEVLESMPGIHLRQDRAYTYTGVRGIERPGDYSSRLLLLIDGVRVNEAIYDSATAGTEFPLDVGLIDRVEFIPGPGSALYGSNALLGVVNVVTRSASQLAGGVVGLDVASLGRRKLTTTWGGNMGEARVLLGLASERSRGHGTLYFPEYDSPENNNGRAVGRDGERNDKLYGKARWGELAISTLLSERRKQDPTGAYGVLFNTRSDSLDRYGSVDLSLSRQLAATRGSLRPPRTCGLRVPRLRDLRLAGERGARGDRGPPRAGAPANCGTSGAAGPATACWSVPSSRPTGSSTCTPPISTRRRSSTPTPGSTRRGSRCSSTTNGRRCRPGA